jgi:DNA-directed RNA polymerase subunit alpha
LAWRQPQEILAGLKFAVIGTAGEIPIDELNLSKRPKDCMDRLGIRTVGDLMIRTGRDLLGCPNFNQVSLDEVREKLAAKGFHLAGEG